MTARCRIFQNPLDSMYFTCHTFSKTEPKHHNDIDIKYKKVKGVEKDEKCANYPHRHAV